MENNFINGFSEETIKQCEFYYSSEALKGKCGLSSQNLDVRCIKNPNCYFKIMKRLEKENDALKNGYGLNCESCSSRIELNKIRDIHNRIVPLKEDQMVIKHSDLIMHGIAFVNIEQLKNYFETAYNARNQQIIDLKNKVATYEGKTCYYCECGGTLRPEQRLAITKDVLQEVMKEIRQQIIKGGKNDKNRGR